MTRPSSPRPQITLTAKISVAQLTEALRSIGVELPPTAMISWPATRNGEPMDLCVRDGAVVALHVVWEQGGGA